jgi:S1-C subfamily serine protease
MRPASLTIPLIACLALVGCGKPEPLPKPNQESAVAFIQPATVKVIAFGNVSGRFPTGAYLRTTAATFDSGLFYGSETESVIAAEYRRDVDSGTIAYGTSFASYAWQKIADRPGNYLFRDPSEETVSVDSFPYSSGTGVVVSEDGVILTCNHVVDDSGMAPQEFVYPAIDRIIEYLAGQFGAEPSDSEALAVVQSLIQFVLEGSQFSIEFTEARVFFPLEWDGQTFERPDADEPLFVDFESIEDPAITRLKNWTYPCTVLAQGESYPGKDVAVLKATDVSGLIAVELAEEDTVSQGETLHTLGFPNAAIIPGMAEAAGYLAVYHSGKVGQIMPMTGGWKAIHFAADINHGDSGGPVFDSSGRLVGLNVAGNPDAPGQNLAVPVSLVHEILKDNSISVGVGESTKKWQDAVLLMQGDRCKEALPKIEELAEDIRVSQVLLKFQSTLNADVSRKVANKYVQERLTQCKREVEKE